MDSLSIFAVRCGQAWKARAGQSPAWCGLFNSFSEACRAADRSAGAWQGQPGSGVIRRGVDLFVTFFKVWRGAERRAMACRGVVRNGADRYDWPGNGLVRHVLERIGEAWIYMSFGANNLRAAHRKRRRERLTPGFTPATGASHSRTRRPRLASRAGKYATSLPSSRYGLTTDGRPEPIPLRASI